MQLSEIIGARFQVAGELEHDDTIYTVEESKKEGKCYVSFEEKGKTERVEYESSVVLELLNNEKWILKK